VRGAWRGSPWRGGLALRGPTMVGANTSRRDPRFGWHQGAGGAASRASGERRQQGKFVFACSDEGTRTAMTKVEGGKTLQRGAPGARGDARALGGLQVIERLLELG